MAREVFTVFEARAAIYLADADGEATGDALYTGGCLNGVRMECDYTEERVPRHGRSTVPVHHVDEEHLISFEQWWVFEDDEEGELLDPDLDRNQEYVLVLAWRSDDRGYWVKRVYYGVTVRTAPVDTGDAMTDNKTLRAERRVQVKGLTGQPALTATIEGSVVWISADGADPVTAYTYDFEDETFTSTGNVATSVMGIDEGGVGVPSGTDWYLQIGTTPILWLDGDGVLRMASLRAMNDFEVPDSGGRVEFRLDATRYLVAMATGKIIVRNVIEIDAVSARPDDFVIRDDTDAWKAAFRPGGIRCASLTEAPL